MAHKNKKTSQSVVTTGVDPMANEVTAIDGSKASHKADKTRKVKSGVQAVDLKKGPETAKEHITEALFDPTALLTDMLAKKQALTDARVSTRQPKEDSQKAIVKAMARAMKAQDADALKVCHARCKALSLNIHDLAPLAIEARTKSAPKSSQASIEDSLMNLRKLAVKYGVFTSGSYVLDIKRGFAKDILSKLDRDGVKIVAHGTDYRESLKRTMASLNGNSGLAIHSLESLTCARVKTDGKVLEDEKRLKVLGKAELAAIAKAKISNGEDRRGERIGRGHYRFAFKR